LIKRLLDEIVAHGDRGAVVPFSRIDDIKNDMTDLKNGDFHTDWLNRMSKHITDDSNKFIPSDISFEPRSLISVVMPSAKALLQFNYSGRLFHCAVPPHYTNWYTKNDQVLKYIGEYLHPLGFSVVKAVTLPQKLLAVHCGLGLYGRNNICYNNEFGSYMQIMTYISDLPCDDTMWYPLKRMESCENCQACVNSCPTKAIDMNRLLVDSDRCITYYDEIAGEFPDWFDVDVHNCIVGCVKCQDCCPANFKNKDNAIIGVIFTENETTELLESKDNIPYSDSLAAKIEETGIPPEYTKQDILPRNLTALLRNLSD